MKLKTMLYTALGFATFKAGKGYAKKRARDAMQGSGSHSGTQKPQH